MPKRPLSVTLDEANLLWLIGRAAGRKRRSLSDALDEILTAARRGGHGGDKPRSVRGTIDIAEGDPMLDGADSVIHDLFTRSMNEPVVVRESRVRYGDTRGSARRKPGRG